MHPFHLPGKIRSLRQKPDLENLMLDSFFKEARKKPRRLAEVVAQAVLNGIPVPAMSARCPIIRIQNCRLPASLLRLKVLGAHT